MTRTLSEGEGKTCPGCGGLGWIPAGDEQLGCIDCNGTGHAPAPPPRPAQDAVGEAAERLRAKLDEVHDSPQYRGVFGLAAAHGHVYDGPDYRIEMIGLRNAISEERPRRAGR